MTIEAAIERYRASGRNAFYYPRKKRVRLDGFRYLTITEAIAAIESALKSDAAEPKRFILTGSFPSKFEMYGTEELE